MIRLWPWRASFGKSCPAAGEEESLRQFIGQHEIRVLNVAGPRESGEPGVGEFVAGLLEAALSRAVGWQN